MGGKNPRAGVACGAGAGVSIASDHPSPTRSQRESQALHDLARYRALHLIARFQVPPEIAVALAVVAFGGGR